MLGALVNDEDAIVDADTKKLDEVVRHRCAAAATLALAGARVRMAPFHVDAVIDAIAHAEAAATSAEDTLQHDLALRDEEYDLERLEAADRVVSVDLDPPQPLANVRVHAHLAPSATAAASPHEFTTLGPGC